MKHHARTIVKPIWEDKVDILRDRLRVRGNEVQNGDDHRFRDVPGLHFLSCCILEGGPGPRPTDPGPGPHGPGPALLVVELSFEGDVRTFFEWVVACKRQALDELLNCCVGYPGPHAGESEIARYLGDFTYQNAVYLGTPGRTKRQISEEEGLRSRIARVLRETATQALPRSERWRAVAAAIYADSPELREIPKRPLRVRLSPSNPAVRARFVSGLSMAIAAALWVAGFVAPFRWQPVGWKYDLVLLPPLVFGILSAWSYYRGSPRGLARAWRGRMWLSALGEGLRTALYIFPMGGLVLAIVEIPITWVVIVTAVVLLVKIAIASCTALIVAAVVFAIRSRLAAVVAAGLAFLLMATYPWVIIPAFLATVLVTIILLLVFAAAIRKLEARRVMWDESDDLEHLKRVTAREYQQMQSHLASEAVIDEGQLRLRTLEGVLRVVSLAAGFWFNRGHLASITSIHFARFIILPGRRTMLFLSNYDDRFEDYLGDFSSVFGVTGVFGNLRGFPRPFLIGLDGARLENLFKRYARASQRESLVWFSAYPDLSVGQIDEATFLREQLARPYDRGEGGAVAGLRRLLRPGLDELALVRLMDGL